jgi:cobyrinic acid a,c-diamide synthase
VQAIEHAELELFIERAASAMERALDIDALLELCAEHETSTASCPRYLSPLGQRVAVARDRACAFIYPHVLDDWRRQGAEILPFSPLADEPPPVAADAIFLPGGYPELHAGKLARSETFLSGLSEAAQSGKLIYGECGGFMILGEYLIDAEGERHRMAGLLPLGTSFAQRKLHLGYRMLEPVSQMPWSVALRGHEFHYSTVDWQGEADPLFEASGVSEGPLGKFGLRRGNVMGSYAHVIAPEAQ